VSADYGGRWHHDPRHRWSFCCQRRPVITDTMLVGVVGSATAGITIIITTVVARGHNRPLLPSVGTV